MKNHTEGRVTASLRAQKEGPVFIAVPSKAAARELAADLMGVSPIGRDLAVALRKACDAPDETEEAPAQLLLTAGKATPDA